MDSLIVGLMKAAVAKMLHGPNAATCDMVRSFFRLMGTIDKRCTQLAAANLNGLGWREIRRQNERERKDCVVLDAIKERAAVAIRRRSPQKDGGSGKTVISFSVASMLTSISGVSMITKRNYVSETISFMFIVMRADVSKPRHLTSESIEHFFGMLRQMIREFSVCESIQLCEKLERRLRLMYKHAFRPSRDPSKGYNANWRRYYEYGLDANETRNDESVSLQQDGDSVAVQLWEDVSRLISFSSELMKELLDAIGVPSDELSPFRRSFQSLRDLRNEYIRYLPRTFEYDGIRGGSAVEDEQDGSGDDDGSEDDSGSDDDGNNGAINEMVGDRVARLAAALAGGDGGKSDDDDGDDDILLKLMDLHRLPLLRLIQPRTHLM